MTWLQEFAASALVLASLLAIVAGALWSAISVIRWFNPKPRDHRLPFDSRKGVWLGWLVGIIVALLLGKILSPAIDVLQQLSCQRAADVERCLDPPQRDYF